jgi:hypothetical protein
LKLARPLNLAALVATAVALSLSGCTVAPAHDYSHARAELDPETGQIVLPLEAYAMNWQEFQTVNHANALLISRCMAAKGLTFPRATQDWSLIPQLPDRRYGLWAQSDAQNNGYELPASPQANQIEKQENAFGDDWWNTFRACFSKTRQLAAMGVNTSPAPSVVDNGMNESFNALLASPEFAAQRKLWERCVQSKGLTLNPDSHVLVPEFPEAGEQQLAVAAIDVDCKQKLNSVQILADWETRYQLPYIDAHEGELTAYRATVRKVLKEAQKVIATSGG